MADNPLKKIFGSLDFFKKGVSGDSSVVGIDIGTSSIKVVQLKSKGDKAVLETYGEISLGPSADLEAGQVTNLPPEKITEALTNVLKEANITTRRAAIAIPSAASLLFVLELPPNISDKEIANVVPTESRKYIPVPISEVSLDYWTIPKKENDSEEAKKLKTEVLVTAIHNDTLSKYRDLAKAASLNPDFFEIESFSSIRSTLGHELAPVLLIDIGASKTKMVITEYGIVKSFHVTNRGSADISLSLSKSMNIPFTKAEEIKRTYGLPGSPYDKNVAEIVTLTVDYILAEASSVLLGYEKKYNRAISKIIFTGGGSLLKGLLEKAASTLPAEVILGNPFNKVEYPQFLAEVLRSIGPEFTVAAGLALRELK
jgi:type IV pilus assembly protein PilM